MAANQTNVDEDPASTKTNARRHPAETLTHGWTTPDTDTRALNAQNYLEVLHNALVNECNRYLYKSIIMPLNSAPVIEATFRAVKVRADVSSLRPGISLVYRCPVTV